ncbi:MAG: carboxylesterase [Gallionellales bacterium RIFOXYB12_FULL_54_9]|nr:MAG: carboxylesterase [Gallionellales bacterium RIFOXYB12_FULL_54_9]
MTAILPSITLDTGKNPGHSIIWLHGLGADGQDFVPIVEEIHLPVAVRYIFPHAPHRPVTINGGFVMRAWYDIASNDIGARQDATGVRKSQTQIEALIAQEVARGIEPKNIFLAGFSQGGAVALHTATRQHVALAGVLVLSAYLPLAETLAAESTHPSKLTPIFMAHGRNDPIVPCTLGIASRVALQDSGYKTDWHDYPMQHTVSEQELRDIEAWLSTRLKA